MIQSNYPSHRQFFLLPPCVMPFIIFAPDQINLTWLVCWSPA